MTESKDYIVCTKKRNNPRIHIAICRARCTEREDCKAYLERRIKELEKGKQ